MSSPCLSRKHNFCGFSAVIFIVDITFIFYKHARTVMFARLVDCGDQYRQGVCEIGSQRLCARPSSDGLPSSREDDALRLAIREFNYDEKFT